MVRHAVRASVAVRQPFAAAGLPRHKPPHSLHLPSTMSGLLERSLETMLENYSIENAQRGFIQRDILHAAISPLNLAASVAVTHENFP